MMRKTVTIQMPGEEPRNFHLEADKAERFAGAIRAKGGTAEVGPLNLSTGLMAMLARAGVDASKVR